MEKITCNFMFDPGDGLSCQREAVFIVAMEGQEADTNYFCQPDLNKWLDHKDKVRLIKTPVSKEGFLLDGLCEIFNNTVDNTTVKDMASNLLSGRTYTGEYIEDVVAERTGI